ncbi:MAG: hypothetical protein VB858_17940 [Planctomycetaceae bacterium]
MIAGIDPVKTNKIKTVLALISAMSLGTTLCAEEPGSVRNSTAVQSIRQTAAAITGDETSGELPELVENAINITSRRFLTANVHTPWQILHGILALRQDFEIKIDDRKVSALTWLSQGNQWKDESIVVKTPWGGEFHRFTKPYHFQGHPNQFLSILTMSELSTDYRFLTSADEAVTIGQMLNNAKMTVNEREEITWTLWALSRYLPIDSEWINKDGEAWSMERLVQIQTYADVGHAACGGTHGLFALSLARNSHIYSGRPLRGIWLEADQKIKRHIAEARALQNPDGTFSSSYFAGPGKSTDFGKRIATSGHILEFLMVAVDDAELQKPWLQKSVRAVASELIVNRSQAADCGPLYHAVHALVLYRDRTGRRPLETDPSEQKSDLPETDTPAAPRGELQKTLKLPTPAEIEAIPQPNDSAQAIPEATGDAPEATGDADFSLPTVSETDTLQDSGTDPGKARFTAEPSAAEVNPAIPDASSTAVLPLFSTPATATEQTDSQLLPEPAGKDPSAVESTSDQPAASSEQPPAPANDQVLEDNAGDSMGMSGERIKSIQEPLPPTSD